MPLATVHRGAGMLRWRHPLTGTMVLEAAGPNIVSCRRYAAAGRVLAELTSTLRHQGRADPAEAPRAPATRPR